ncbi:MAG TPA: hypothetical protein VMZ31_02915 [Phycisphaerae bacterium]|nr:hypothetical protein [Phycisphaerae bacterium]
MGAVKLRRFAGNPILRANPANEWEAQNVSNAVTNTALVLCRGGLPARFHFRVAG